MIWARKQLSSNLEVELCLIAREKHFNQHLIYHQYYSILGAKTASMIDFLKISTYRKEALGE